MRALMVSALVLLVCAAPAAADITRLATVPGTIVDAAPDRVLYLERPTQRLMVQEVAGGAPTAVPLRPGGFATANAKLIDGGVVYVARDGEARLWLDWWRGDVLRTAGAFGHTPFSVAGDFLLWSSGSGLARTRLSSGRTDYLTHNYRASGGNAVAANGDAVFATLDGALHWLRDGRISRIGRVGWTWASQPVFDGTAVAFRRTAPCCESPSFIAYGDGPGEIIQDTFREGPAPQPGVDYMVNNGWIAFTRPADRTRPTSPLRVWTRDPQGRLDLVHPEAARLQGISRTGQVLYRVGSESQLVARGERPFRLPHAVDRAFWADGRWHLITGATVSRLDVSTELVRGPDRVTPNAIALFELASSVQGARYECRLDDRPAAPCSADPRFDDLAFGTHTVTVTAIDPETGERDATPATYTWVVTPPSVGPEEPCCT
ncbi:hypothetical protein DVA67_000190 [Solirubrobacter sp. CPCC 204708]|uniref:Uncharacterized protein n=1 Tax=Solirubrobacter deserti TaxID=2282478 RepID=A0ABT4RSC0_9ACTN|nr:hypothetical protein [Solirubrobacter deserti]MBE2314376.1 hypothetical protein [Solirubrobacter deserti]MDA0141472.1 hypothetical protein [Solirubrobacter deserti]